MPAGSRTVDHGTALGADLRPRTTKGIAVHVFVDETRPTQTRALRSPPGSFLHHGVPHTVIADNAGGHLMQA